MAKSIEINDVNDFFESKKSLLTSEEYKTITSILMKLRQDDSKAEQLSDEQKMNSEDNKNRGNEAFKEGKLDEAIEWYTKSIECNPNNYLAYSNRSLIYHKLNMNEEAIADCLKGIELEPKFIKFYIRLVMIHSESDIEASLKYCKEGLKIDPKNANLKDLAKNLKSVEGNLENIAEEEDQNLFDQAQNNFDMGKIGDLLKNKDVTSMIDNLIKDKSPEELQKMMGDFMGAFKGFK